MLYDYQLQAKKDTYAAFKLGAQHVLGVLPTGGGKTVIMADICKDAHQSGRTVLILVHRDYLVSQTIKTLARAGVFATKWSPSVRSNISVGMVQTVSRYPANQAYDLIITDEAHHAVADTYRAIYEQQPHAKHLGLTASPVRLNGQGLGDLFQQMIVYATPQELIDKGYLLPTRVVGIPLSELSTIKTARGDYAAKDLAELMRKSQTFGDVIGMYNAHAQGKRGIVFAASVELSKEYAAAYNAAGVPAAHIDGTTPEAERKRILDYFSRGAIQILCNYAICTEGFDVPAVEFVQILRPTKSLSLYLQMIGRAMRTAPNKTHAIVLDHGCCTIIHGGKAEATREWVLHGKQPRLKSTIKIEEFNVLDKMPTQPTDELKHHGHVLLTEITNEDVLPARLMQLIAHVKKNHWKASTGRDNYNWALQTYRKEGGLLNDVQLKEFAKIAGYHWKWAARQTAN